jgi:multidrug efflux pump subunit AcrA (membrane-fusion protein)/YHS domain-containing protein
MELVPVYEGEDSAAKVQLSEGAVSINPERQRLIGVRVQAVEKNTGSRMIRTTGRVEAEDNRVYRLTAATEGWVQSAQSNPTGLIVKKNELLATFYSREFRNAQQAYLGALASVERAKSGGDPDDPNSILRVNEEQLHALGMGDPQIKELAKKRQTTRDISLVSPADGVVLGCNISPGQRFEKGTEFCRIADLSKVWIMADLFDDQAGMQQPGSKVKVIVRELSKTVYARVAENPPLFDPASRTLKLRLEAENHGLVLRPDMFVDVEFTARTPWVLAVPQEAVLDSGLQKIVYVETSEGVFQPRRVTIGTAYGNFVTVTSGLTEGERVVTSGNFLLDSESRMRSSTLATSSVASDTTKVSSGMSIAWRDPVCARSLDPTLADSAGHIEKYHGETFRFCSDNCQKKFREDPARYAGVKLGSASTSAHVLRR